MSAARSPVTAVAAAAVTLCAVVAGVVAGGGAPATGRAPLAAAVSTMPRTMTVVGFTDWRRVTDHYTLSKARERDLVTRSALIDEASEVRRLFGWRLGDVRWEIYGRGPSGGVAVVRLDRALPTDRRLRAAGFRQADGIWHATGRIGAEEHLFNAMELMPRNRLVVMSDHTREVVRAVDVIKSRAPSLASVRAVADAAEALAGAQTALIQVPGLACQSTNAALDVDTASQVRAAEARFGQLARYRMLGRGLTDDGSHVQRFVLAMPFRSASIARRQAEIRAHMSEGPFVGRSEAMSEVLRLRDSRAQGTTAVLSYGHPADAEYLMTGQGPLLPASC